MSLIVKPTIQTLTPQQQLVQQLQQICTQCHSVLVNARKRGTQLVWQNPTFTPAQAFAALGTDAAALVQFNDLVAQLLVLAGDVVESPVPEGTTLVCNQNGTVTLASTPSAPKV